MELVSSCCGATIIENTDLCSQCKEHSGKIRVYDQDEIVDMIIAYEGGEFDHVDTIRLFSQLLRNGSVWRMQGGYGRMAHALIHNGYLEQDGTIITLSPEFDG